VETSSSDQVELEKEKTRQVCYKQQSTKRDKVEKLAGDNSLVLLLLAQNESLNNAMSLLKTGKNYDPCPSSTNQSDVEIADSAMYSSIYNGAFKLASTGLMVWGGVEIAGDLFSALGRAGGYNLLANGEGSSINIDDAFKTSTIGNNSTAGAILSNPIDQTAEPVIVRPEIVDPTVITIGAEPIQ